MSDPIRISCCVCKTDIWLPTALHEAAIAAREIISFYCPYGHAQVFLKKKSEPTPPIKLEVEKRDGNVVSLGKKP